MVYKNNIDPVQKQYWPSTKAILTQYKSGTGPVQKQYWPGTKAIPFDTVFSTVTQRVCTGSTGTRYKSGTGIRYRYVYRNGVQDVYRKVPYRYLVPYTTIPNRYHLPPLNSTGTGTQTQTQTEFYSTSIEIKSVTSGCKNNMVEKIKGRLNAWYDEYACWETSIKVRPDRLYRGHPGESTWPGVLIILMTKMFVH